MKVIKTHPCPHCEKSISFNTVIAKNKKSFLDGSAESIKICPYCQNEIVVERSIGNMLKTAMAIFPVLIIWILIQSFLTSIVSTIFTACCIFYVIATAQYFDSKNQFIKNRMK